MQHGHFSNLAFNFVKRHNKTKEQSNSDSPASTGEPSESNDYLLLAGAIVLFVAGMCTHHYISRRGMTKLEEYK